MDSPSPGRVATSTRHTEPENTNPDLAEVLDARPAIPPQFGHSLSVPPARPVLAGLTRTQPRAAEAAAAC